MKTTAISILMLSLWASASAAFEGEMSVELTRGSDTKTLLYAAGCDGLRIEVVATARPNPINLVDFQSSTLTVIFPHNRSFMRLKSSTESNTSSDALLPFLPTPSPPSGIGPTNLLGLPARSLPQIPNLAALPSEMGLGIHGGMPAMSAVPMMPMFDGGLDLKATGEKTKLLGYDCARYEIKQRDEVMEIWATDQLMPFQSYLQSQPLHLGPRMMEEQWGDLLKTRRLFPLLATLKLVNGAERLRFEVKTITPGKLEDKDRELFQPPADYREVKPLPF